MRIYASLLIALLCFQSTTAFGGLSRLKRNQIVGHMEESIELMDVRMQTKIAQHALKLAQITETGQYWTYLPLIEASFIFAAIRIRHLKYAKKFTWKKGAVYAMSAVIPTGFFGFKLLLTSSQKEAAQKALDKAEALQDEQINTFIAAGAHFKNSKLNEFDEEKIEIELKRVLKKSIEKSIAEKTALVSIKKQLDAVKPIDDVRQKYHLKWVNKGAIAGTFLLMLALKKSNWKYGAYALFAGEAGYEYFGGMTETEVKRLQEQIRFGKVRANKALADTAVILNFVHSAVGEKFVEEIIEKWREKENVAIFSSVDRETEETRYSIRVTPEGQTANNW